MCMCKYFLAEKINIKKNEYKMYKKIRRKENTKRKESSIYNIYN